MTSYNNCISIGLTPFSDNYLPSTRRWQRFKPRQRWGCVSPDPLKNAITLFFCNRSIDTYVIQSMNNSAYLWTEAMRNGSLQSFAKINPLVGLPPKTLRLYSVLGVFKKEYSSSEKPDWFRVPEADQRLKNIGLSKRGIEKAFQELVRVDLLQIHEERDARWYSLK